MSTPVCRSGYVPLFNILADALEWILKQQRVTFVVHYLDDFLTTGSPDSSECQSNLDKLITTCSLLGIPLATEKIGGPATSLEFLGIELDSMAMEARLSPQNIRRVRSVVHLWLPRRRGKKLDVLSMLGPGRTFMRRMFNTVMRVRDMDHFVHLNKDFRSDLHWWQCFLESWNGASFFALVDCQIPSVSIQTDASGNWGCGASFAELWFQIAMVTVMGHSKHHGERIGSYCACLCSLGSLIEAQGSALPV